MSHLIGEHDRYLFNEGTHAQLDRVLGAHPQREGGVHFAVWAPSARGVRVIGDWNHWGDGDALAAVGSTGIWAGVVAGAAVGHRYKYRIEGPSGERLEKADPVGFWHEAPPKTASVIVELDHTWGDAGWMAERGARQRLDAPMSIYEVHLGSWRRSPETPDLALGYRELARPLAEHAAGLGFTHVELLPVTEHPFYGSWGYQTTGYFAPTARYGTPQDFMFLVDTLHQHGLGVILDWVPGHFPTDAHGLYRFDGTHLYEHADPRSGFHPDWNTAIFNYGRHEVRSFLLSSARFWLDRYHLDGLRVDGVASMLYLDYSRQPGEWIPNRHGGRENLEAIDFLRRMNEQIYRDFPDVQTMAEESTAWPMVSRPTSVGGLGFGLKWDMGWMHDTLEYVKREAIHRRYHHGELTFRAVYAWNENFVLPLSHDEVVHGKGSLWARMPGDPWQKLAGLRLLYAYQCASPGKKLLFMGGELGQPAEWKHDHSLDWHLADDPGHAGLARLVGDLNRLYRDHRALHLDCDPAGFAWIELSNADESVLAFERRGPHGERMVCALNFTPVPRLSHPIGVERGGTWREVLNTDAAIYGGSGVGNLGQVEAEAWSSHGRPHTLRVALPPLGAVFLEPA